MKKMDLFGCWAPFALAAFMFASPSAADEVGEDARPELFYSISLTAENAFATLDVNGGRPGLEFLRLPFRF